TRSLEELFVKSNRATLLWVLPFSGALVLFAPDIQRLLLGPRWHPAVVLVQGLAVATALAQLGFNWFAFYRAHGHNRPAAIEASLFMVVYVCAISRRERRRMGERLGGLRGRSPRAESLDPARELR